MPMAPQPPTESTATAPPYPFAPPCDRVAALADIRRAASLGDIRVDVAVAHTKQRLRARFCVSLCRPTAPRMAWAFGVEIKEAKQFATQLRQLATTYSASKSACPMCKQLHQELKRWPPFPAFSSIGKRHLDAKCTMLSQFFDRVFCVLAQNAAWLQSCELLRAMLRLTETLCRVQYANDRTAVRVLASLKRVTPVIRSLVKPSDCMTHDGETTDCSICLCSLLEPAETSISTAKTTTTTTVQPTQGVKLPCGHYFHDLCISLWFHTRLSCPVCRQPPTIL